MSRELKRLQQNHRLIADLYLQGLGPAAIALELDGEYLPDSVSRVIQSPLMQDFISRRRREIELAADEQTKLAEQSLRERVVTAGGKAVGTLEGLLGSESEGIQLKSASELLSHAFQQDGGAESEGAAVRVSTLNINLIHGALAEANSPPELPGSEIIDAEIVPQTESPA